MNCRHRIVLDGLERGPARDLKSTISVSVIFHVVPRAPWYKAEASMSPRNFAWMVLYLSRPEHPLLSALYLGGLGGRALQQSSSEGWYFSDPDPEEEIYQN